MGRTARSGFTLIEALIALSLLAIIVVKIAMIMNAASETNRHGTAAMALEDQARRVLDNIAYAVMGADRGALFPDPESPDYTTAVDFQISLGVEGGVVIWADPEWIGKDDEQVVWKQNPLMPEERRVAWCNTVRPFLEGEIDNGVDDNGNGLTDEEGLSFTLYKNAVTIRLCLERQSQDGTAITQAVETVVTIRN